MQCAGPTAHLTTPCAEPAVTASTGDDSAFLVDRFDDFLRAQLAARRPWLAHLSFHAIHEPHPAMPHYYQMYGRGAAWS